MQSDHKMRHIYSEDHPSFYNISKRELIRFYRENSTQIKIIALEYLDGLKEKFINNQTVDLIINNGNELIREMQAEKDKYLENRNKTQKNELIDASIILFSNREPMFVPSEENGRRIINDYMAEFKYGKVCKILPVNRQYLAEKSPKTRIISITCYYINHIKHIIYETAKCSINVVASTYEVINYKSGTFTLKCDDIGIQCARFSNTLIERKLNTKTIISVRNLYINGMGILSYDRNPKQTAIVPVYRNVPYLSIISVKFLTYKGKIDIVLKGTGQSFIHIYYE